MQTVVGTTEKRVSCEFWTKFQAKIAKYPAEHGVTLTVITYVLPFK